MELSRTNWRKSSKSSAGGQECVEVAAAWRKSSKSQVGGNECVEVASTPDAVLIRDSKDATGPRHVVTSDVFRDLLGRIKSGRLDL
ncbi:MULTISPECIES: DUF397 domain-containing protein [Actinomadura]|uniref:DUF397 domain-containing protein n=2 Tax=Actinomadura TaxID=1988 RepID=A0A239CHD0_9ACTN|nr:MULTISPECIES: DUF397 domain-containing protein [Actinomadura]TMR32250.1 DUF397 domain-containing protein [Actinomadura geliboluensis]SNS18753.1 protein of unknown function [Actinomadura meyerae]